MTGVTLKQFKFFRDNAGYVVGERAQNAIALSRAENTAQERDWYVIWEPDDIEYDDALGDHAYWCNDERAKRPHTHEIVTAILKDADYHYLTSLGGVIDPTANYERVIEAELAIECLCEICALKPGATINCNC